MRTILILFLLTGQLYAQQKSYVFVFLNKKMDKAELPEEEVKKLMEGHMNNINRLAKEGKLLAAGPFDGGGGIFVFNSTSVEDVKELIKTDPAVSANRWNVEVLNYYPRTGSICPVGEKYEMTNYYFIRFKQGDEVLTKKLLSKHLSFISKNDKSNDVVTEAHFGDAAGSILITKSEWKEDDLKKDPAVAMGALQPEFKKIFIAKGSFCEK